MIHPLARILEAWLFRPEPHPAPVCGDPWCPDRATVHLVTDHPQVGASSSGSWPIPTKRVFDPVGWWICPQCFTTWPKKPWLRSHPFPQGHRSFPVEDTTGEGEGVTLFARCPGRPVKVVG